MALKGIQVIELAGLAPVPHAGLILADFGANVVRIDRVRQAASMDRLARGKMSVAVNLKKQEGISVLRKLCKQADVLIEPFRPGVLEKMGLGPKLLLEDNPRLVIARLTGFGQSGKYMNMAGHDINYIATSGVLGMLGRPGEKPHAPHNLLADFAGGGLTCAFGIVAALLERTRSGKGQVIDANMLEGSAYVGSFLWATKDVGLLSQPRGTNLLDGAAPFYDTYETSDGKYMAVGALEPQFYQELIQGLGLADDADFPSQMSRDEWPVMREKFTQLFATKTRAEWTEIFDGKDACVTPVLTLWEAPDHPHNKERQYFLETERGVIEPGPAPRLTRTPALPSSTAQPGIGQDSVEVLKEAGYTETEITELNAIGAIEIGDSSKL
ncbi:alpha-methylacyl-CoA racemase-like [Amphiura filiformis]|uniref:alpha-methylacyl-CoA racemase-like n=1 Tax=Amphiura filiformis TaxID=82378 RepID=UPI003B20EADF